MLQVPLISRWMLDWARHFRVFNYSFDTTIQNILIDLNRTDDDADGGTEEGHDQHLCNFQS